MHHVLGREEKGNHCLNHVQQDIRVSSKVHGFGRKSFVCIVLRYGPSSHHLAYQVHGDRDGKERLRAEGKQETPRKIVPKQSFPHVRRDHLVEGQAFYLIRCPVENKQVHGHVDEDGRCVETHVHPQLTVGGPKPNPLRRCVASKVHELIADGHQQRKQAFTDDQIPSIRVLLVCREHRLLVPTVRQVETHCPQYNSHTHHPCRGNKAKTTSRVRHGEILPGEAFRFRAVGYVVDTYHVPLATRVPHFACPGEEIVRFVFFRLSSEHHVHDSQRLHLRGKNL
mmetsp:Transcript_12494/g.34470  ORF Transcript_12494/g.34470 Transcript_12494/m.34470 type:complete len:282 (-) Transcript_12494:604-1449(-)